MNQLELTTLIGELYVAYIKHTKEIEQLRQIIERKDQQIQLLSHTNESTTEE